MSKPSPHQHQRHWFDYDAAAAYLGLSRRQVERAVSTSRIGYTKPGNRVLFSQEQLDAFLVAHTVEAAR